MLLTGRGPDTPTILAEGVTDWIGRFSFRIESLDELDEAVLLVRGKEGEGRKLLTHIQEPVDVEITYPIIETVVLLHDNDLHFNFNHPDRFKAKVDQIRERYNDVYLLNAGDIFVRNRKEWIDYDGVQKDYEWYGERCLFMIDTMNEIGYDVMTAGNHDFVIYNDYTGKALEAARFPILAANVEITTDLLPPVLPYTVFTTGTLRQIAILGLTAALSSTAGVELDRYKTVEKYLYLAEESDIFIALTHIEVFNDIELAKLYPEFDVIIGGHCETLLEKGISANGVLIAQAGGNEKKLSEEYPKYLGMVVLTLENGVVVDKKAQIYQFEIPQLSRHAR
ncbi:MAG: metallophosphoesterase [Bacillota bacterium]